MKQRRRLHVEVLEGRALLSGLSSSLRTDHPFYQASQPIQMTFTETNLTRHPIPLAVGPSTDGFAVSQHGTVIWTSNAGPIPMFIVLKVLQPGQSFTVSATWNGMPNAGDAATSAVDMGTFVVFNELDPTGARATFQIVASSPQPTPVSNPPAPVSNPTPPTPAPEPVPPVPMPDPTPPVTTPSPTAIPVSITLTTSHPTDRRGHPVRIRVVLTDVGDGAVGLTPDLLTRGLTISQGARVVWRPKPRGHNLSVQALQPGQSVALTTVWNGRPNQPGLTKLSPGTYTIQVTAAGQIESATIRIV
jgi:hypothetical protein